MSMQLGPLSDVVLPSMMKAGTLSLTTFNISSQHSYFQRGGPMLYSVSIVSKLAGRHIYVDIIAGQYQSIPTEALRTKADMVSYFTIWISQSQEKAWHLPDEEHY